MTSQDIVFFKSRMTGRLNSETLSDLRESLKNAGKQKNELEYKKSIVEEEIEAAEKGLRKISWFPIRLFRKYAIEEKIKSISTLTEELNNLNSNISKCRVGLNIDLSKNIDAAFGVLSDKYAQLASVETIWDLTTSQKIDRVKLRTSASNSVERLRVRFRQSSVEKISCDYKALILENANGDDLYIFPLFAYVVGKYEFALIDLRDIKFKYELSRFVEDEPVPRDSKVVGSTWAKVNKDGSRDKRFTDNHEIPVVEYGVFYVESEQGLNEAYMISNPGPLIEFITMLETYITILAKSDD